MDGGDAQQKERREVASSEYTAFRSVGWLAASLSLRDALTLKHTTPAVICVVGNNPSSGRLDGRCGWEEGDGCGGR